MAGLIAHEWIEARGGSENVLEAIAALHPDADIVTPWNNAPERFPNHVVRELWLGRSPLRDRKAASVPFLTGAWRRAVPASNEYDWVLASSHLFAHHIKPRGLSSDSPKLIYAYTPARYIWTPELDNRGSGRIARLGSTLLRPLDRSRSHEALGVASISEYVRDRIAATWEVDSKVVYPPVETAMLRRAGDWRSRLTSAELFCLEQLPEDFVLGASRFIPYKRLDLVIQAGEQSGIPVVLAGSGPDHEKLAAQAAEASVPVVIVHAPSSAFLYALYQAASVFVFPPVEDFGIMPVEAMALGTPVVASATGGSAETVTEGLSGVHFEVPTRDEVGRAISAALDLSPDACRQASMRFSRESFDASFTSWMATTLQLSDTDVRGDQV